MPRQSNARYVPACRAPRCGRGARSRGGRRWTARLAKLRRFVLFGDAIVLGGQPVRPLSTIERTLHDLGKSAITLLQHADWVARESRQDGLALAIEPLRTAEISNYRSAAWVAVDARPDTRIWASANRGRR